MAWWRPARLLAVLLAARTAGAQHCASSPCQNSATCAEAGGSYTCACPSLPLNQGSNCEDDFYYSSSLATQLATGQIASACQAGSYYADASDSCVQCAQGYYCLGNLTGPVGCPVGTHGPAPALTEAAQCLACAAGTVSTSEGAVACTPCPAGFSCPDDSSTVGCPSGTYSYPSETACSDCPAGFYCPFAAAVPRACLAGYYSADGATVCTVCPAGSACAMAGAAPVACTGPTEVSSEGATACTPCPAGFSCADNLLSNSLLNPCAAGTYSLAGEPSCADCQAGFACSPGAVSACPAGTFSNGTHVVGGQVPCIPCPAGYMCLDTTQETLTPCVNGTFSAGGQGSCTVCPAGYACPNTDASSIEPCAAGSTYSVGGQTACLPCQPGFLCTASTHTVCAPGTYAGTVSGSGDVTCSACPPIAAGSYCAHSDANQSQPCPAGTASSGGSQPCVACGPGEYAPSGSAACLPCPLGVTPTTWTTLEQDGPNHLAL